MRKVFKTFIVVSVLFLMTALCLACDGNIGKKEAHGKEKVTITFSYEGANGGDEIAFLVIEAGDKLGELPTPTKEGYTFEMWSCVALGGKVTKDTIVYGVSSSYELKAYYKANDYKITFDYNGASSGVTIQDKFVTFGDQVGALPAPKKTDMVFMGWFFNDSAEGDRVNDTYIWNKAFDTTLYAVFNDGSQEDNETFLFEYISGGVEITGLTELGLTRDKIIVPSTLNGKDVVSISERAFSYTDMTELEINAVNANIGRGLLNGNWSIERIKIPLLNDFNINRASYLHYYFSTYTPTLESLIQYITIPISLKEVEIVGENTQVPKYAFHGLSYIQKITLPSTVQSIGDYAFSDCLNLEQINNLVLKEAGKRAFYNCESLTQVKFDLINEVTIGDNAFSYAGLSGELVIPSNVKSVGSLAFCGNTNLTSARIENVDTQIGYGILSYCDNIAALAIPLKEEVNYYTASYLRYYFITFEPYNSSYMSSQGVPTALNTVTILGDVEKVPSYMFYEATMLEEIYFEGSNPLAIGNYSFYKCRNLKFSEDFTVSEIGEYAFTECVLLQSITLTSDVKKISTNSFRNCTGLSEIVLPASVEQIDSNAFYGCTKLVSITVNAINPPTLSILAFYNSSSSLKIYVPAASLTAYMTADMWRDYSSKLFAINN